MKWIIGIIVFTVGLFAALYIIVFTAAGNRLLTPVIEQKVSETLKFPVSLSTFVLRPGHFEMTIQLTPRNSIEAAGSFSLFSKSIRARYHVMLDNLIALKPLTKRPLQGRLATEGSVTGTLDALVVNGSSDLAESRTDYILHIDDLTPASLKATIKDARIDQLLTLAGEAPIASGTLQADVDLKSLDPAALKGSLDAKLLQGGLNTVLIKKRFGIALAKNDLALSLKADLDKGTVLYDLKLDSSLAAAASKGKVIPKTLGMDLTYRLDIAELGLLESITKQPLRGPLKLSGTLKGDRKVLNVSGHTDLAQSDTVFHARLEDLQPRSAELHVKKMKLGRLLYLLRQPHYASADITVNATLEDLRPRRLDGTVDLDVRNGIADKAVVSDAFQWPYFKGSTFSIQTDTKLKGDDVDTAASFKSDLMKFTAVQARYNVSKQILTSDFAATVPDLNRLYFITERPLRGKATVTGDIRYDKTLLLHAKSAILGGTVNATLDDKKLHADLSALQTLQALDMLTYPQIFDAILNGTLDYNLGTKKGLLAAKLSKGHFTQNSAFDLLRQYTTLDLYREQFKGDLKSRINDSIIDSDLSLKSHRSVISSRHALFDAKRKRIDAKVHVDANNNPIDFYIKGNVEKPDINIDANKLIEREAGKQINRLLNNLFK